MKVEIQVKQFIQNDIAGVSGKGRIWIQLCVVTVFPPHQPASLNWKLGDGPTDQWDSSSWAHSQQKQYLTQPYLPHLPRCLTSTELILTLYPVWHLNKDASEERSSIHIGEECYKQREQQVQWPWGRKMLSCFWGTTAKWESRRQELPLERKPGVTSFRAIATHFKKINFQEHLVNRLWCFTKAKKHD